MRHSSLSSSVDHLTMNFVVVVMKCIYEPYVFSHSVAMSSAECIAIAAAPLQLELWAADTISHCFAFAIRKECVKERVGCCKAPLLSTGCFGVH